MNKTINALFAAGLIGTTLMGAAAVRAEDFPVAKFPQRDGETLFKTVCQACHMPEAQGAVGAAAYPALAKNNKLKAAVYPIYVVVNGQRAMPAFGASFDDEQIANVVNYVRTHFGNHYTDKVKVADVKAARPVATAATTQP